MRTGPTRRGGISNGAQSDCCDLRFFRHGSLQRRRVDARRSHAEGPAAQLGVGNAIRLVVAGQIAAAVTIDHVGAFGAVVQRLTMGRAIGVVLMIVGVILARR